MTRPAQETRHENETRPHQRQLCGAEKIEKWTVEWPDLEPGNLDSNGSDGGFERERRVKWVSYFEEIIPGHERVIEVKLGQKEEKLGFASRNVQGEDASCTLDAPSSVEMQDMVYMLRNHNAGRQGKQGHLEEKNSLFELVKEEDVCEKFEGLWGAAIRRPGAPEAELRPRKKTKQNFEFDENKAQIFRLKLSHAHLHSRLHFDQFHKAFSSTFVALFSLVLHMFLKVDKDHRILQNATIVPVLLCFVGVFRVCVVVFLVSFEQSASKRLDKQCSVMLGILGFVVGVLFVLDVFPKWAFDFRLEFLDGFGKLVVSVTMGGLAGLLYMPAARNARAFWLGTDQSRSYLSIISCGWIERLLLYGSSLLAVFTALLWVSPFANLLVNKNNTSGRKGLGADELVGNVGMSSSDFDKFRQLCLLVVGILQMLTLRTNVQIFLNEAVLSWYQRLHASKVPDLDFSRAKIGDNLHKSIHMLCSLLPCTALVKEVALFMAWWVIFIWSIFTAGSLALYRRGILYVS
ncbi:hypothetical protein AgCh_013409 [Apium graveolens]